VGTVAAGVAKAYADIVQISGYEGGTGASPITSIKNVGNYWEIGLSDAQRVLIENGLRDRITLRVDGGLRTGKDVVLAALFGAEEFGFGTATIDLGGLHHGTSMPHEHLSDRYRHTGRTSKGKVSRHTGRSYGVFRGTCARRPFDPC